MNTHLLPRAGFAALSLMLAGQAMAASASAPTADDHPAFSRTRDVIYGRAYGTSLTMDVFTPRTKANGLGIILVVSGSWISNVDQIRPRVAQAMPFVERGYTVFGVLHRSQPRFTLPEMIGDLNRSVRYIRYHSDQFKIDPDRLGIYGASSGGHLSLMQAMAGDDGQADAKDPVDRVSSRVQAVGCLRPPTDFLNYGAPGETALGHGLLKGYKSVFAFHELDSGTKAFEPITDPLKIQALGRAVSPAHHVTADDPPTLIIHGDADKLVPIQQAELLVSKLQAVGVEAKLIRKPGIGHGTFPNQERDVASVAEWFDTHLKRGKRGS